MPIILLTARRGMVEANPVNKVNALSFICSEKGARTKTYSV